MTEPLLPYLLVTRDEAAEPVRINTKTFDRHVVTSYANLKLADEFCCSALKSKHGLMCRNAIGADILQSPAKSPNPSKEHTA